NIQYVCNASGYAGSRSTIISGKLYGQCEPLTQLCVSVIGPEFDELNSRAGQEHVTICYHPVRRDQPARPLQPARISGFEGVHENSTGNRRSGDNAAFVFSYEILPELRAGEILKRFEMILHHAQSRPPANVNNSLEGEYFCLGRVFSIKRRPCLADHFAGDRS